MLLEEQEEISSKEPEVEIFRRSVDSVHLFDEACDCLDILELKEKLVDLFERVELGDLDGTLCLEAELLLLLPFLPLLILLELEACDWLE
mmetsp:Transcript_41086/g.72276  ORF Transcript_41086/g.72276 Transcript_41086/m.72276 type:complete len:90 (+) Transcript_41086:70-339(+)